MNSKFEKIKYVNLNAKQKENYNFHKVASALADYGFNSMRLNDDWQGADFIAIKGEMMLKVQLKGRFVLDKKYEGKDIYIAYIENKIIKLYNHDFALKKILGKINDTKSWVEFGSYSWPKTPQRFEEYIHVIFKSF
jgi:hypothetical protein